MPQRYVKRVENPIAQIAFFEGKTVRFIKKRYRAIANVKTLIFTRLLFCRLSAHADMVAPVVTTSSMSSRWQPSIPGVWGAWKTSRVLSQRV